MGKVTTALVVGLLVALNVNGQVTKCVDKTGKVTYTNGACNSGDTTTVVARKQSDEQIAIERTNAAIARERTRETDARTLAAVRALAPAPQKAGVGSFGGPSAGNPESSACKRAQHELKVAESIQTTKRDTSPEWRTMQMACGLPEPPAAPHEVQTPSAAIPEPPPVPQRQCRMGDAKDRGCYRE